VVASGEAYNLARPDLVVMAITSQMRPTARLGEGFIHAWHGAGLLKPSVIKPVSATPASTSPVTSWQGRSRAG
jgi:mRNA interferase MazF